MWAEEARETENGCMAYRAEGWTREAKWAGTGLDGRQSRELLAASFTSCWRGIHIAKASVRAGGRLLAQQGFGTPQCG